MADLFWFIALVVGIVGGIWAWSYFRQTRERAKAYTGGDSNGPDGSGEDGSRS